MGTNFSLWERRLLILFILFFGIKIWSFAQADPIEHLWYNEEKTAKIRIYKTESGKFCGRIVWLKVPEKDGKPKVDSHNPDKSRQNDPLLGLLLLKNFTRNGEKTYENGSIYDPKNGKTYSCTMTRKGDVLDVRGYIGFSFIGRTTVWTRAEDN
jgi:uncharacterized protein (DUF2147 family)